MTFSFVTASGTCVVIAPRATVGMTIRFVSAVVAALGSVVSSVWSSSIVLISTLFKGCEACEDGCEG